VIRLALLALVACGSSYEPKPESADDANEAMVITFEEMARFARDKPTCVQWAVENGRRWGAKRLKVMIERMASFDKPTGDAFRAKYGARIDATRDDVLEISERCLAELSQ
jgi:hypothetical protein